MAESNSHLKSILACIKLWVEILLWRNNCSWKSLKFQNGLKGAPKWPTGSALWSTFAYIIFLIRALLLDNSLGWKTEKKKNIENMRLIFVQSEYLFLWHLEERLPEIYAVRHGVTCKNKLFCTLIFVKIIFAVFLYSTFWH